MLACALLKYGAINDTRINPIPPAITYHEADKPYLKTFVAIPVVLAPPVLAANKVPASTTGPRDFPAIKKSSLLCFFSSFFLEAISPIRTVAPIYNKIIIRAIICVLFIKFPPHFHKIKVKFPSFYKFYFPKYASNIA